MSSSKLILPVAVVAMILTGVMISAHQNVLVFGWVAALAIVGFCKARSGTALLKLGVLSVGLSGVAIGPMTVPDLFLVPAGAALAFGGLARKEFHVPPWLPLSGALILAGGLLPFVLSYDTPPRAGTILLQFVVSLVLVPFIISLGAFSSSDVRRLAECYVLSAAITSLFAVLHFTGVTNIASSLTGFQGFEYNRIRVSGLMAHPNQLGLMCGLAIPLVLYLVSRRRVWLLALVLILSGVMVSGSRSGLVALVMAVVLYLWMEGYLSARTIVKGIVVLVVAVIAAKVVGLDVAVRRLAGAGSVVEADRERLEGLKVGIRDVVAHPLTGVGFGKVPHNLYVELVQGGGILVLCGFAAFATGVLKTVRASGENRVVRAAAAAMAAWLLAGMLHPGLYDRYLYVPAGIVLAGAAVAHRARIERRSRVDRATAVARRASSMLAAG